MPDTSIDELHELCKSEKKSGALLRLKACILRKKGHSLRDMVDNMSIPLTTVSSWLRRMHAMGPRGRYHDTHPGAACKMTPEQISEFKADLLAGPTVFGFESGMWTVNMILIHVKNKYDIAYTNSGMRDMLHRLGLSWRKPRPKHPKAPIKEQKKEFKKKAAGRITEYTKKGYIILTED